MQLPIFRLRFPEFARLQDDYVQAMLTGALPRLDTSVWGAKLDEGHGYLTAHLMAVTPAGITSGLSEGGRSLYGRQFDILVREVAGGPYVI